MKPCSCGCFEIFQGIMFSKLSQVKHRTNKKQIKRPTVLFRYWDILCGIFQAYASNLGTTPILISETLTIKHAKITQYL